MFSRMEYTKDGDNYVFSEVVSKDAFSEALKEKPIITTGSQVALLFICFESEPDEAMLLAHGRPESVEKIYYDVLEVLGPDSESAEGLRHVVLSPDVEELNRLVAGVHLNGTGAISNPSLGNWLVGLNSAIRSQYNRGAF